MVQRQVLVIDAGHQTFDELTDDDLATPPGGGGAVDSVNGQTGVVVLDASDVGADVDGAAASAQSAAASDATTKANAAQAAAIAASQPVDSDLTAIAALTTTSYGRAFLALADAAAGRTALGLGTAALSASGDFQPIDSDLTAIAALTTTSYGRALLALADAAAARTALALGTAATAATGDFDAAGAAASAQAASWPATTAFDATAPTTSAFGDAAAAGSAAKAAHRDHTHGREALPAIDATAAATDITTRNVSTSAHGLAPKLPNDATKFLDGTGGYTVPPGTGLTNPMTTAGDLIVGGASGVPARLAKGSDSQVLTVDPTTHLLVWATASSGFADPMTSRGDVIIRNASNTTARLAKGSAGQYLGSDGTDVAWATPSFAALAHPMPLDSYAIDATYGDDFTGGSLSGSWTRRNYTSGAEAYQVGKAGTYLRIAKAGRAAGDGYFRTAPSGDWTFAMAYIPRFFGTVAPAWGVAVVDTNGTGVAALAVYTGAPVAAIAIGVTTYSTYGGTYVEPGATGTNQNIQTIPLAYWTHHRKVWLALRKSSGNYYCSFSFDGEVWSPESATALTWAGTPDRIGMVDAPLGTVTSGTGVGSYVDVDWFNKIA